MIYTIATLRTFVRSLDNRLQDTISYPDAWIDDRIEEGLALAQEVKQTLFYTKELYDVSTDFKAVIDGGLGLSAVEIVPQREVHSIWAVECDLNAFTVEATANNHVIIRRIPDAPLPSDYTVTIRYFFYWTLPFTEIELHMEVYKICKSAIASVAYMWLSDEQNEQYHLAKVENMMVKGTFDLEKDLMQIPVTRLWSASWA